MNAIVRGALGAAGLGVWLGMGEVVRLAFTSPLPWSPVGALMLATAHGAAMGAVGLGFGVLAAPAQRLAEHPARAIGLQAGLAAFGVLAVQLVGPGIAAIDGGMGAGGAVLLALVPLGAALASAYARVLLGREDRGGLTAGLFGVGVALLLALAAAGPALRTADAKVPAGERTPPVLLVTLEGVGVDAPLTALDALASRGVRFTDAVAPSSSSLANHTSLLSGLHPLRHLAGDDRTVGLAVPLLAERLAERGYATAGFVSGVTVAAHTGLGRGTQVYDDDFGGMVGAEHTTLGAWWGLGGVRRADADTVARFEAWHAARVGQAWFAWVQLADAWPGGSGEVDVALARLVAAVPEPALIVVAGTRGVERAGDGEALRRPSLREPVVHVPLVVVPATGAPSTPVVEAQVRLHDVAATVAAVSGLGDADGMEGVSLLDYAAGGRDKSLWTSLVGRDEAGWWLGVRVGGVKVVRAPDGSESLYDLRSDPGETTDLAAQQVEALTQARGILTQEETALRRIEARPTVSAAVDARIRAWEGR